MSDTNDEKQKQREGRWAPSVEHLNVGELPRGARGLNVQGRHVSGALQGFGQMWQKTYRVRLPAVGMSAVEAMQIWKAEFPNFQPPATRFYPPMSGIEPGQIIFINLMLPVFFGLNMIPVESGVMVLYADDESFSVMTPEGFPVSGWNTFSIFEEDGCLVAQVQSMDRAADPIYELGTLLMGGARRQEENWTHVLTKLAERLNVTGQTVEMKKECVDPRWQWRHAMNVWQNASVRTVLYIMAAPLRWARNATRRSKA